MTGVGKHNQLIEQKKQFENYNKDLSNVILFEETSKSFSDRLTKEMINEMNVGGIIIDGDHSYEAVTIDYELAIRLINKKKNSIILFDDIQCIGVQNAIDTFLKKYKNIISSIEYKHNVNTLITKLY
jgi:hypothetical protein